MAYSWFSPGVFSRPAPRPCLPLLPESALTTDSHHVDTWPSPPDIRPLVPVYVVKHRIAANIAISDEEKSG